jgi:hypothetical protein
MAEPILDAANELSMELEGCTPWLVSEDTAEVLAAVSAIPDGIRLARFPGHTKGPECWCRPKVTFSADTIIVSHKDLNQGDFDS